MAQTETIKKREITGGILTENTLGRPGITGGSLNFNNKEPSTVRQIVTKATVSSSPKPIAGEGGTTLEAEALLNILPDNKLAVMAKKDPDAFGILYQRHVRTIYSYVRARTGSTEDAEDITARTFYQALFNMPRYQAEGAPFGAWLFRIAHNLIANFHRDNSRRPLVPLDGHSDKSDGSSPVDQALDKEERQELRDVIALQNIDRQYLLQLKFVEELSNEAIAQKMGRTQGAVKALLHRTVVDIRDDLTRKK